jgi:hypothetical protein
MEVAINEINPNQHRIHQRQNLQHFLLNRLFYFLIKYLQKLINLKNYYDFDSILKFLNVILFFVIFNFNV